MIYVYNLETSAKDAEYSFGVGVSPEFAVCYAFASEHNLLSLLFSTRNEGCKAISEVFPVVYGKHSVSCGDFVAALTYGDSE